MSYVACGLADLKQALRGAGCSRSEKAGRSSDSVGARARGT
jgi:hypothetical protein